MTDQVRIGFIGAGLIANRHLGDLLGFHDVRVVAVADLEPERAAGLAERCGGTAYAEFEEMLDREHLDGVYICVPPFAHGQPEAAVLDRGLPFFVEKPLGADLATAETIAARVAAESIVTATGYHWRYLDITERAQALLAEKRPIWRSATGSTSPRHGVVGDSREVGGKWSSRRPTCSISPDCWWAR